MVGAVFDNMKAKGRNHFTVGIEDDVTHTSLKTDVKYRLQPVLECKFYGLGSDGTVVKNSIKIIGCEDNLRPGLVRFKKAGAITISHLRFGRRGSRVRISAHAGGRRLP